MADVKLHWQVAPSPTGRYRSFDKRGWPTAYYGKGGKPAAFIYCEDSYNPAEVREGSHGELTVNIAHHQHPRAENGWEVVRLARRAKTLDEAKALAADYINRHPEVHPRPAPVPAPAEVPLEMELATALLALLESMAYRKAGGDQFVMNIDEPKIVAQTTRALVRAGYTEDEIKSVVGAAEYRARHP